MELNECDKNKDGYVEKRCLEAVNYIQQFKGDKLTLGRHDINEHFFYYVHEYETTDKTDTPIESHKRFVDIQMLVEGKEIMQVADIERMQILEEYNEVNDRALYHPIDKTSFVVFRVGSVLVLHPKYAHRLKSFNGIKKVRKILGKLSL